MAPASHVERKITLTEFEKRTFPKSALSEELATELWERHGKILTIDFPSPKTQNRWELTAGGWVGVVPIGKDGVLAIQPKVPIASVFRMLEYAYRLDAFSDTRDVVGAGQIQEMYETMARLLARRVRDRARKGLYRTYVERRERLAFVRGRLDLRSLQRQGLDPRLVCTFEEHTADVEENQLILFSLDRIVRSGLCGGAAQDEVRSAWRSLRGRVGAAEFTERDAVGRSYTRLNHDYRGLHALCRFFLAHTGPTHRTGTHSMAPFQIEMAGLFERFVSEYLKAHLPNGLTVNPQEPGSYDPEGDVGYRIDLVLYDESQRPLAVLDTKYKRHSVPAPDDVAQVLAYATKKRCSEAILIYPWDIGKGKDFQVGGVRVRTVGFALDGDIDGAGQRLLLALPWPHGPILRSA